MKGVISGTCTLNASARAKRTGVGPFAGTATPWPPASAAASFARAWRISSTITPPAWRTDLWDLIRATPALIWVLLSKRPQNAPTMLPPDWHHGWPNVWLGTTVENNLEAARRIPHLAGIPAALRFLSVEPLLEVVDLAPWLGKLHWVICGGESGAGARPTQPDWVRNLRDQVHAAGAKLFVKQLGSNRTAWPSIKHPRGENPAEWPEDLRVQQIPG
jgi:protein gp37